MLLERFLAQWFDGAPIPTAEDLETVIRRLSPAVVNQIAAGEVVERPVSVVKELFENALDAGALRVRIEIDGGGAERIAVIDDGDGFLPKTCRWRSPAMPRASCRPSPTSTTSAASASAARRWRSIGAVSRALVRSRRRGAQEGWEIRCEGGVETTAQPCGAPEGRRLEVRDLFYNVPARRRFLKSAGAERARIQELVAELSLARLDVDLTLVADGRELLRLPLGDTLAERFARCFGAELRTGLLPGCSLRVRGAAGGRRRRRPNPTLHGATASSN